ncbi:MAG: SPFH domain-containing protein [Candidatus Paceibacterota bacterium]
MWILLVWAAIIAVLGIVLKYFIVSVPEVTGLLTVNVFTGGLTPYGPGLHLKWPWEQVKEGLYINLRVITENMEETYPSQDGPAMLVKWSFQYRPSAEVTYDDNDKSPLERYISSDDNTIKQGLKDVGSSILSANIAGFPADDCKKSQQAIETELRREFETMAPTPQELYGIELIRTSLADVDYEPTVQAVRASEQVAAKLRQIATAIRTDHPEISQKDAMNAAMIIHGKIKKDVVEVEGKGGEALAALLIAMSRGGK